MARRALDRVTTAADFAWPYLALLAVCAVLAFPTVAAVFAVACVTCLAVAAVGAHLLTKETDQ